MENVVAVAVIIGFVSGVQYAYKKQWESFTYFLVAMVAGVVFGSVRYFGLEGVESGLVAALSSAGLYKVAKKVGGE